MPQLILSPWFLIFAFTWISFLALMPKKILSYASLNNFIPTQSTTQATPWLWPW